MCKPASLNRPVYQHNVCEICSSFVFLFQTWNILVSRQLCLCRVTEHDSPGPQACQHFPRFQRPGQDRGLWPGNHWCREGKKTRTCICSLIIRHSAGMSTSLFDMDCVWSEQPHFGHVVFCFLHCNTGQSPEPGRVLFSVLGYSNVLSARFVLPEFQSN